MMIDKTGRRINNVMSAKVHTLQTTSSVSEKRAVSVEKERRMDVPQTQMQYDDKSRVDKAKRCSVVEQTESKNKVELFLHLPQYERGNQLPNLSSNIFTLDTIHHAVYKVHLLVYV